MLGSIPSTPTSRFREPRKLHSTKRQRYEIHKITPSIEETPNAPFPSEVDEVIIVNASDGSQPQGPIALP